MLSCAGTSQGGKTVVQNGNDGWWHREGNLLLLPSVEAGQAGWCMMSEGEAVRVSSSGGNGCTATRSHPPIVAESWGSYGPPHVAQGLILTTSEVSAVTAGNGPAVFTRRENELPDGLRAAMLEVKSGSELKRLQATPLDRNGNPIAVSRTEGQALSREVSAVRVRSNVNRDPCQMVKVGMPSLTIMEERAVPKLVRISGLVGRAFLSCASVDYLDGGVALNAGVLLDAGHPGVLLGRLPKMRPVAGHRGIWQALGQEGQLVARRIGSAWLVVVKGKNLTQRLELLKHIVVKVHVVAE